MKEELLRREKSQDLLTGQVLEEDMLWSQTDMSGSTGSTTNYL